MWSLILSTFLSLIFGFLIGQAVVEQLEDDGSSYNPFVYYNVLGRVQNSPWSWLSGTLWDEAREVRRTMFGAGLVTVIGGIAGYVAGPSSAFTAMKTGARMWETTQTSWRSWESNYRRPQTTWENFQAGTRLPGMESLLNSASDMYQRNNQEEEYGRSFAHYKDVW